MNSEELELSLRTEFESYLKDVFADMRQEISQFQEKIEAEFEKHKSQLDEFFKSFPNRIETDKANLTTVLRKRSSNICVWRVMKARELPQRQLPKRKIWKKNPLRKLELANCAMR